MKSSASLRTPSSRRPVKSWANALLAFGLVLSSAGVSPAEGFNRESGPQASDAPDLVIPVAEIPQLDQVARRYLRLIQQKSIAQRVEYCAYIYRTGPGRFVADKPVRGEWDGCTLNDTNTTGEIVASFHTHAAYDRLADSEVPSVLDLETDMTDGLVGYIATPAGRFWRSNYPKAQAVQICGTGCMPVDANREGDGEFGKVPKSITLDQLRRRQAG